jgi:ABC-type multidrug transport system fused ATPase/permease subunit
MQNKNEIGNLRVLRTLMQKYMLGIPQVRTLLLPILISILIGKYLEVEAGRATGRVSQALEGGTDQGLMIFKFMLISMLAITFIELQGFVFIGAVKHSFRHTLRNTFAHFITMDVRRFNSYGTGTIQSIVLRKSKAVSDLIEVLILSAVPVVLTIVLMSVAMLQDFGLLVVIVVDLSVFLHAFSTIKIALWRTGIRARLNRAENRASNILYDSLSNHEAVACFNSYDAEIEKYDGSLVEIERSETRLFKGLYILNFLQKSIFALMNGVIVAMGVYAFYTEKMSKDKLAQFLTFSRFLMSSLNNLGYTYCKYSEAMVSAREAFSEDLKTPADESMLPWCFKKDIAFRDVSFSYANKNVLSRVSFTLSKGDKVAVIGANGAGKSTLLKVFLKFVDYDGSILVDGADTQRIATDAFREFVGYVPQNPTLFNDTVRYNIKYGNREASDYAMMELAKRFRVHDNVMRLERGYCTAVGESGRNISGGERQKIAILRALLRKSEVIAMDEPTSSLDKESEYEIMKMLVNYSEDLTVIAVVHNLDLLGLFDKICLLENGKVRIVTHLSAAFAERLKEEL